MQAPTLAGAKTPGILVAVLAGILGIFVYLVPAGSFPVGWDAFWNLHVAKTWAESGFPGAMPEAGFTQLAERFSDRQLLFHGLLALVWGEGLDASCVPPSIWFLVAVQVLAVFAAMRIVAPTASPMWLGVLPALSATWIFRATALRDMLLGVLPLLGLVALLTPCKRLSVPRHVALAALAAFFGYVHGAVVLPVVVVLLACLGRRIDSGSWSFSPVGAVLAGLGVSQLLRPDFPHNLELLGTLNYRLPLEILTGGMPIRPSEFATPSLGQLVRGSTPFVLALAVVAYAAVRRELPFALTLPVLALGAGAVFGSRLFELAVPLLVLALAVRWPQLDSYRAFVVLVAAVAVTVVQQIPTARRSVEANRVPPLREAADWLVEHARPGDTVFVTDWATTSPLAWFARGKRLRYTGVTDPTLMKVENPEAFAAWEEIKLGRHPAPVRAMSEILNARFLVVQHTDTAPGLPVGATSAYLFEAMQAAQRDGWAILSTDVGPRNARGWKCYRFER